MVSHENANRSMFRIPQMPIGPTKPVLWLSIPEDFLEQRHV